MMESLDQQLRILQLLSRPDYYVVQALRILDPLLPQISRYSVPHWKIHICRSTSEQFFLVPLPRPV